MVFANSNADGYKPDFAGFGSIFPHPLGAADGRYYTTFLTLSPFGDRMTADFAKTLIDAEDLGDDEKRDN